MAARDLSFPCPECGPTTWMLSLVGPICSTCGFDADEADPTEKCHCYDGYTSPAPNNKGLHWSQIPLGPLREKCMLCNGKGRKPKHQTLLDRLGISPPKDKFINPPFTTGDSK